VVPVLASADHPRLPPGGVDVLLLVDTYKNLYDRPAYSAGCGGCSPRAAAS
jgi:hypothetical protein